MNILKVPYPWRAIAVLGLATGLLTPAYAWDPSTVLCIKQPAVYCPTPPAKESADAKPLPQTGSPEAWRRAKFPWLYPTSATRSGPIGYYPAPGTPEWFRCYKLGDCRKP